MEFWQAQSPVWPAMKRCSPPPGRA